MCAEELGFFFSIFNFSYMPWVLILLAYKSWAWYRKLAYKSWVWYRKVIFGTGQTKNEGRIVFSPQLGVDN